MTLGASVVAKMPRQKPGKSKQDYGTPDDFLGSTLLRLGIDKFDCDLACRRDNRIPCARTGLYFPEVDSLAVPWPTKGWNWLNPEYADIRPWAQKCAEQWLGRDVRTAFLVPASVGSEWWYEYVHDVALALFLRPRLKFKGMKPNPKTGKIDPYPKDLALILYGEEPGYDSWRWDA